MDGAPSERLKLIKRTAGIIKPGLNPDQLMKEYERWQNSGLSYDEVVTERGYNGPRHTAAIVAKIVPNGDRAGFKLLDVGAGTGLLGHELQKYGFNTIDALEPSADLLGVAEGKHVYRNVYQCFMTGDKTPGLASGYYDGLVTCGCIIPNHLPVESLDEMIRVVKPGGVIVITTRRRYILTCETYKDILEPYMNNLETQGRWTLKSRDVFPNYYLDDEGIIWSFRIL